MGQGKAKHSLPTKDLSFVLDNAGWLKPAEIDSLRIQFRRYEKDNGIWFNIWTEPTLAGQDVDYTNYQHYNTRKLMHMDSARGVVLSFFAKERQAAIWTGINLEDKLTEERRKNILENVMQPLLKAGKNYAAITAGVAEAQRILAGMPDTETRYDYKWFSQLWRTDIGRVILVFFVIISGTVSGMIITKYNIAGNNNHLQNIPLIVLVFLPVVGAVVLYLYGSMRKQKPERNESGTKHRRRKNISRFDSLTSNDDIE